VNHIILKNGSKIFFQRGLDSRRNQRWTVSRNLIFRAHDPATPAACGGIVQSRKMHRFGRQAPGQISLHSIPRATLIAIGVGLKLKPLASSYRPAHACRDE
jgi:hypothetical protein